MSPGKRTNIFTNQAAFVDTFTLSKFLNLSLWLMPPSSNPHGDGFDILILFESRNAAFPTQSAFPHATKGHLSSTYEPDARPDHANF